MLYSGRANFTFYDFEVSYYAASGLKQFIVQVADSNKAITYNNGGNGFPVQDDVVPQPELSCQSVVTHDEEHTNHTVVVTAAVSYSSRQFCREHVYGRRSTDELLNL
jgi:hypothetical protein